MFDQLVAAGNINFLLVFLEGLLSFLSPCIVPLLPVYLGYLAGGAKETLADGTVVYDRGRTFWHTLFFVAGISMVFFLLGWSFSVLGGFFSSHQALFSRLGGLIIICFGLTQLGILSFDFLNRERRLRHPVGQPPMGPLAAFVMGFTFSFAWTPCVGPMLSSVLILAAGAENAAVSSLLVLCYVLGFVIPFLLLGLFTTRVLNFFKTRQHFLAYTVKAGGVVLIVMGISVFTGWFNNVSNYLNPPAVQQQTEAVAQGTALPRYDFTLTDQYGNSHTLSEYKGQVVMLNFWATWCGYCKREMPDLEGLYAAYGYNADEVVILGVAAPSYGREIERQGIEDFLSESGYTYPTVFDETGQVFANYGISSYPTTYMIDKKGNFYGYVPGAMTRDIMINVIEQTLAVTDGEAADSGS